MLKNGVNSADVINDVYKIYKTNKNYTKMDNSLMSPVYGRKKPLDIESNKENIDFFHVAIGKVILCMQIFFLMPVAGVRNKNVNEIKFKWFSIRTILAILLIGSGLLNCIFSFMRNLRDGFAVKKLGGLIFFSVTLFGSINFFLMSLQWGKIMRYWRKQEDVFLRGVYTNYVKRRLSTKIKTVGFGMLFISLIEYTLGFASSIYKYHRRVTVCKIEGIDYFKNYTKSDLYHVFLYVPYNEFFAIYFRWINICLTMAWNFTDIFIMLISIGLAHRFNQINQRIVSTTANNMCNSYWIEIRRHYIALTELLRYIDNKISLIILLSCANNLYFICIGLFDSFHPIQFLLSRIYFWFSIFFILFRALLTLFMAAYIHDNAKKPLSFLRAIPTKYWNIELQRFSDQIIFETMALSGRKFFYLTRNLILAMAGTVVTYELVLLDEVETEPDLTEYCN